MKNQCAVCGKWVETADQDEHLATNHLGPHDWWCDGKKYRTQEPSLSGSKIIQMAGGDHGYFLIEERDGKRTDLDWSRAVNLTGEPHFYTVPPATY